MELEFARAKKLQEREREKQAKERQARAERERRARAEFDRAETIRLEQAKLRAEQASKRAEREELESLNSGGIRFVEYLRPVPLATLETDRVRLPPSILDKLIALQAMPGDGSRNGPIALAFELAVFDDREENHLLAKTHVGVQEFVAEEGTVQLPVKVAMSLGEAALLQNKLRVRLVRLDALPKALVRIQPKGEGFHLNDAEVVNMDLKRVLTRVLANYTTLSQGDVIPLRHEGRTFVLNVVELLPESPVLLINTDLEVDLLPCERVEQREMEKKQRAEQIRAWKEAALARAAMLKPEPSPASTSKTVIALKARLPGLPTMHVRRFDRDANTMQDVFDWAQSLLGDVEPPPQLASDTVLEVVVGPGNAMEASGKSLAEAGLLAPQVINFRWKESADVATSAATPPAAASTSPNPPEWTAAQASAETVLDRDLQDMMQVEEEEESSDEVSRADMFRLLIGLGAERTNRTAMICQKYHASLVAMHKLGLIQAANSADANFGQQVIDLVDKFKGSTSRVADGIMQLQSATAKEDDWKERADTLQAMFIDRSREDITRALHKHGGNLERAAGELLL